MRGSFTLFGMPSLPIANMQTADLKHLALSAREAVEHGTPFDKFLEESCDTKLIFVEILISEDMDLLISLNIKLTDQICDVKKIIERTMVSKFNGCDFEEYVISAHLSQVSELDPTLEHDKLKLSWKSEGIDLLLPRQINDRMDPRIVNISSSDTVGKLKAQIRQVTCIAPENQLLRYQNRFLVDDSKSLADYGINFYFGQIFRWCRQAQMSALEVFPSIDWAKTSENCGLFPCVSSTFAFDAGAGAASFLTGSFHDLGVGTSTGESRWLWMDEGREIGEGNELEQLRLRKLYLLGVPKMRRLYAESSSSHKKRKLYDPETEEH